MPIATASDFEIAPAHPLLTPLVLAAGRGALTNRLLGERLREIFRSSTRTSLRTH